MFIAVVAFVHNVPVEILEPVIRLIPFFAGMGEGGGGGKVLGAQAGVWGLTRAFLGVKQGGVQVDGGRGGVGQRFPMHVPAQCFFGH